MSNIQRTGSKLAVLLSAIAFVGFLGGEAFAQKPFLNKLRSVLSLEKEKNGSCKLCHEYDKEKGESAEKDNINAYGKLLQGAPEMKPVVGKGDEHKFTPEELNAVEAAVKATGDKDVDGDGATNIEELMLGTYPADKASTPDKAALEKFRAEHKK